MSGKYDFTLTQNATFSLPLTYRDSSNALVNLTGYSAALQIRDSSGTAVVSLTDGNGGGITLGGSSGTIQIDIPASVTALLDFTVGRYDLFLYGPNNYKKKLLEGVVVFEESETS